LTRFKSAGVLIVVRFCAKLTAECPAGRVASGDVHLFSHGFKHISGTNRPLNIFLLMRWSLHHVIAVNTENSGN
jgi:hypothetical protein